MVTDAFAQAAGGPAANPGMSTLLMLLQFLPIFVIFYFLFVHPQRKRQKEMEKMIKALKKGDRVLTSGGIFATVVGIDDTKAVLRISEQTTVEFSKSAIVQVLAAEAK